MLEKKKCMIFIPESNNANNLSEMLPNELWRKTFMSLNAVLGCGIVIYKGFIFPLKKSHKKSEQNIKQRVCLMKIVFYMLLASCGCEGHPPPRSAFVVTVLIISLGPCHGPHWCTVYVYCPGSCQKSWRKVCFFRTGILFQPIGNQFPVPRKATSSQDTHIQPERKLLWLEHYGVLYAFFFLRQRADSFIQ